MFSFLSMAALQAAKKVAPGVGWEPSEGSAEGKGKCEKSLPFKCLLSGEEMS